MLLKTLILVASLAAASPGLSGATDALDARDDAALALEKRGFCGKNGKFGMNCRPGGKCFPYEVNCCKGGKTYCPYAWYCIDNGKKCCPDGRWCPSWWPWKRDGEGEGAIGQATDAGEA